MSFTSFIPSIVLSDKNLKVSSKLIYGVLEGFRFNGCTITITNKQLQESLGLSENTVCECIKELEDTGYISRDTYFCPVRQRNLRIINVTDLVSQKSEIKEEYTPQETGAMPSNPGGVIPQRIGEGVPPRTGATIQIINTNNNTPNLINAGAREGVKNELEDGGAVRPPKTAEVKNPAASSYSSFDFLDPNYKIELDPKSDNGSGKFLIKGSIGMRLSHSEKNDAERIYAAAKISIGRGLKDVQEHVISKKDKSQELKVHTHLVGWAFKQLLASKSEFVNLDTKLKSNQIAQNRLKSGVNGGYQKLTQAQPARPNFESRPEPQERPDDRTPEQKAADEAEARKKLAELTRGKGLGGLVKSMEVRA